MNRVISFFSLAGVLLATAIFSACGVDENEMLDCGQLPEGKIRQDCINKDAPKADRWDRQNDPQLFGVNLEYKLELLPRDGSVVNIPWPDTYWPTYEDSVNARWQGQSVFSPLEKYDLAFNNWTPPDGFDRLVPFRACGVEFDKDYYEKLGPAAKYWSNNHGNKAMRDAWDKPDCDEKIETWWGLCHAWVPASILEPEPKKAVTYNGVTFEVGDIKALLVMAYNDSVTRFVGRRCNLRTDKIERDEYGRIKQTECRDSNPGTMHVLLANLVGRDRRSFAEDRTMNYEVWNQPLRGFKVKSMEEITEAQATKLINPNCQDPCDYIWNPDAVRFFRTITEVYYITESNPSREPLLPRIDYYTRTDTYDYILELDAEGKIIGGEWLNASSNYYPSRFNSQMQHPDFFWLPLRAGYPSNPYADLEKIRMLLRMSLEEESVPYSVHVYKAEGGVAIPDNDPNGASVFIDIPDDLQVGTLRVTVGITHSYIGDLTLILRHEGQEEELQRNAGGSTQNLYKTFEVSGFSGSAKGRWELWVVDNAARDTGTVDKFEIALVPPSSTGTTETFANNTVMEIPDNSANGIISSIQVPGSGPVKSVKVKVDITHTWISDLTVELRHGTGASMLHNREGGSARNIVKTFSVDEFNGAESGGEWTLQVIDHVRKDTGRLNSWQLVIER